MARDLRDCQVVSDRKNFWGRTLPSRIDEVLARVTLRCVHGKEEYSSKE
jgi:hypothetical protein